MMDKKENILNYTLEELRAALLKIGLKPYLAKQIYDWIYKKFVIDFNEMSNISKTNREMLISKFNINALEMIETNISRDKAAIKYKFKLIDNSEIETVVLNEKKYYSLCISSQVGCPLGCKFCVTGMKGFKRNLTVSEIIGQVIYACEQGYQISRIVFMGMGEPMLNYDAVLKAIDILNREEGLHISKRKMTVSTIGIIDSLKRLIEDDKVLNLALSIGSVNPIKRKFLMPVEKDNPLLQIITTLNEYQKNHNRKLTLEYTLIKDQNDSFNDIQELANIAKYLKAKINLINLNPHPDIPFKPIPSKRLSEIKEALLKMGVITTIRFSKGADIAGACGQLG
jgi:23S rRNA (adenine2503-C2)-methyltransferase